MSATIRPIVPAPYDDERREVGRMSGRGNRNIWEKPAPVPLYPLQIPHDMTWT
jgi:hypothetical protein